MEKELEKLQRQLAMAIKERRYARMAELQRKIAALQNVREHVPLSFLLPKFTPQERDKALVLMHQVFVFADMLYGAALEFEEYLKGFDRSVTLSRSGQGEEGCGRMPGHYPVCRQFR